jgi:SAM-dependent methyltransferase
MKRSLAALYFEQFGNARRILDVGCGGGEFGRYRPSPDVEIHGVDVDAGAIEKAAQFEIAIRLDLEAEPLPYEDGTFDAVLAKDIFEHVYVPSRLAREIFRVTRRGGIVIASVVMARASRVWDDYTHVRGFTRRSARALLEDVGFTVEAQWRMGPVPLSDRLGLMPFVPHLLRLPVFGAFLASSLELRARK